MNRSNAFRMIAFVVVAAIFVAVRFWNITATCLWFDEIFSVHAAEHSWNSILDFVAVDLIHPPLFYLLLKVWIAIGGESLIWLRSLPVLFSIIAIVPFGLLCREMRLGLWTSLFDFLLIAVNGSLIKYAQEVRMYSMLMCMSLFSIWLFLRYFRSRKGIVALTVVNILLIYTHYFGWWMVLVEAVVLVCTSYEKSAGLFNSKLSKNIRKILAIAGIPFLTIIPWFVAVVKAASSGSNISQNIGWMQRPDVLDVVHLCFSIVEPFYYAATSVDARSVYSISLPMAVTATGTVTAYFVRIGKSDLESHKLQRILAAFCIIQFFLVLVSSWLLPYSIWGSRHLIIIFVPASILIANAVTHFKNLKIRTLISTILVLFVCYAFVVETSRPITQPAWCGFEPIADKLQSQLRGPIYVFEDLAAYHLWFRFRNCPDAKLRQRVVKVDGFPGMPEDKAYFIPRGLDDEFLTHGTLPTHAGFWIVYRATSFDLTKPPLDMLTMNGMKITQREVYDGGDSKIYAVYLEGSADKSY